MIIFRAEVGPAIGAGHAMRCLALAEAAQALGLDAALSLDDAALAVLPRLAASGVRRLGPEPRPCAVAVLDGYGFSAADEAAWAAQGATVAVLEDAPGRAHACDLLIDPAPGRSEADYRPWTPPGARVLLGPAYAPLLSAFAQARPEALARRARGGSLRRVLVSTGMTDVGGAAPRAVAALRAFPSLEAIVVAVSASAASAPLLHAAAGADPRIRLHFDARDMAALMAEADLAVGSAGVSCWERCAMGLPSVVLVAAENQHANAGALTAAGAALVAGDTAIPAEAIAGSIAALAPAEVRMAMSRAAAAMTDGRWAARIVAALVELRAPSFRHPRA